MGMYDTFALLGDDARRVTCAAGHPQGSLQSKDLDCNLDDYFVFGGRLYESRRGGVTRNALLPRIDGGDLVIASESRLAPSSLDGDVEAYTHCEACDPVVFDAPAQTFSGGISEASPWVEWRLYFKAGLLVECVPVRNETRDDVRREHERPGYLALPDDDRIARRHIEQWRARRGAR